MNLAVAECRCPVLLRPPLLLISFVNVSGSKSGNTPALNEVLAASIEDDMDTVIPEEVLLSIFCCHSSIDLFLIPCCDKFVVELFTFCLDVTF